MNPLAGNPEAAGRTWSLRTIVSPRTIRRLLVLCSLTLVLWLLVSLVVADRLTRRPHSAFAEPPPAVAWGRFEPLRLRSDDGEDIGAWFLEGEPDAPSVLLVHGNRGRRGDCLDRAEIFVARGCSLLLISLRAHGDSSGQFNDIGYGARHDIIAAVDFLERRRPGKPVLIHGLSMGAASATFASRSLAHRVNGYILESPYRDLKVAVRNRTRINLPPLLDWVAYQGLLTVSPLVLPDVEQSSPLEAIAGIPTDVPVLIMAGSADRLARPEESRALFERVSAHGTLLVFEGAGHTDLLATSANRYRQSVLGFVDEVKSRWSAHANRSANAGTAAGLLNVPPQ
jgi:uncharacterized protein